MINGDAGKNVMFFFKSFIVVILYALSFFALQHLLFRIGIIHHLPDSSNLLHWDARWYHSVAEKGYEFDINKQSNSGFFCLFPAVWRLSHLGVYGICTLNLILFAIGTGLLAVLCKLPTCMQNCSGSRSPPFFMCLYPTLRHCSFF